MNDVAENKDNPSALKRAGFWIIENLLTTKRRKIGGHYLNFAKILAFLTSAFYVYTGIWGLISPELHRGIVLCVTMILVFAFYPAHKYSPQDRFTAWDMLLMLLAVACVSYFVMNFPHFVMRFGRFTTVDHMFAWILIGLVLETARRGVGVAVPLLAILMLLYATTWVGPQFSGLIAHRGFSLSRIAIFLFTTFDGLFGIVANTIATFVVPFVILVAFMVATGVGKFFVDLPYAAFGGMIGGTAIVAVVAGMLLGLLSGSPTANALAVGAFVIPLMMKTGYSRETSAGIAAAASTGAMFTPPVMGSAVFFMVEFTGISYMEILKFSAVPSMLFYLGMLAQARLNARKMGIMGVPDEERPDWREVLKKGWYLSTPLFVLVIVLLMGYTPTRSALVASFSCVVVSMFRAETRMTPKKFFNAMSQGGMDLMVIGSVAGAVGIIIGMIALTGLGTKFTVILIQFSGGQLHFTILLTALACIVIGLGVPIGALYIILATLMAPAMIQLGVTPAAAHLLLIWFSQLSGITPPVALTAFSAAAICGGDPMKTGIQALRYGLLVMFVPLMFVYTRILEFGTLGMLIDTMTGVIAVLFLSGFLQGYWSRKNHVIESLIFGVCAFGLFTAIPVFNVVGIAGGLSVWAWQRYTIKRSLMAA